MKQKNKYAKLWGLLTLSALGAFCGYFIGKIIAKGVVDKLPESFGIFALLSLIPAMFLVIAWHEAGHAIAGVLQKFSFRMYVVGPFMWKKEQDTWHFKWNKNLNTAGGMVVCVPTDKVNLGHRFMVYAAGGPIASLILAVVAFGLYKFVFGINSVTGLVFLLLTIFSGFIFIATMLPLHSGGFYTDGARILRLWQGGDKAKFDVLLLNIIAQTSSGKRYKFLDINELTEAQQIAQRINEPHGVYMHSYLHQAAFDKGDYDTAETHLANYINDIDSIPEGIQTVVWLEAAFFYAYAKRDLTNAQVHFDRYKPSPIVPKAQVLATEATLSFLKNDITTALSKIEEANKELPKMFDKGAVISLEEKLLNLKSECEKILDSKS